MENNILHFEIKPHWEVVNEIHNKTQELVQKYKLKNYNKDSIIMVTTELIENAVKYGKSLPEYPKVDFSLSIEDNRIIKIVVTNGIKSEEDLNIAIQRINQLKTDNPKKLFENRLLELMNNPNCSKTQLGLIRIVYEGQFELDYKYKDKILTVIANRSFYFNRSHKS